MTRDVVGELRGIERRRGRRRRGGGRRANGRWDRRDDGQRRRRRHRSGFHVDAATGNDGVSFSRVAVDGDTVSVVFRRTIVVVIGSDWGWRVSRGSRRRGIGVAIVLKPGDTQRIKFVVDDDGRWRGDGLGGGGGVHNDGGRKRLQGQLVVVRRGNDGGGVAKVSIRSVMEERKKREIVFIVQLASIFSFWSPNTYNGCNILTK